MNNDLVKSIGNRIRGKRSTLGLTQQDIAVRLNITPGAYAKIERGETDPSISRIYEIAEILGIDPLQLITESSAAIPTSDASLLSIVSELRTEMHELKSELAGMKKKRKK